ncbi:DoxX family protein [Sphingobacterium gobiense]|uniref:DoxX-like family protein n=1 Tax=Sphingobacterium gobiense TaxID=1382456 RepID=A0A2S9JUQ1_9SPHI|nr:DoxX family protein [Sphingobacterium gobiense]PRD57005.1 DoxX-like family protein [Sphingobacterium gobiense]
MKRRDKIIYWIATLWLSLGMFSTGIVQIIRMDEEVKKMNELGYPVYFLTIIGVWKILGGVAVLVPRLPLVKEWAYAGFFFLMTGAIFTHIAVGDEAMEYFGPSLLLVLTMVSWYFRPNTRKLLIHKK